MSLTKVSYSMITGAPYNILDYGADQTGSADSTTAIQSAINAANAVGGGVVFIPAGTYAVTTIDLKLNVSIYGVGYASKLISTGTGNIIRYVDGTGLAPLENVFIRDFYINGTNNSGGSGIWIQGFVESEISGMYVHDVEAFGSLVFGAKKSKFLRNTIDTTRTWDGMTISVGSSIDNIIESNYVLNSNDSGIGFTATTGTVCVGNIVDRTGVLSGGLYKAPGIDASGAQNAVITGNYVIGNQDGILLTTHVNTKINPKRVVVSGNTIADSLYGVNVGVSGSGPYVGAIEEISITGNKIFSASVQGIHVDGYFNTSVTANDISNCGTGILVENITGVTITANVCYNNSYGVNLGTGATDVTFLANNVYDNSTANIIGILYGVGAVNVVDHAEDYDYSSVWGVNFKGTYTVGTLPYGNAGWRAFVTDATAPTFLGALTGGGTVKTPVFHNGSAWVAG